MWEECKNGHDTAIDNYVTSIEIMENHISFNDGLCTVEVDGCKAQINELTLRIQSNKNKNIVERFKKNLTLKTSFDTNMNLIGFSNGVYDFDKMEFRQGKPSDMIKTSCGYDFCSEYKNKEYVENALLSFFPNKESMVFFMLFVASTMCGKNNSKLTVAFNWNNSSP